MADLTENLNNRNINVNEPYFGRSTGGNLIPPAS